MKCLCLILFYLLPLVANAAQTLRWGADSESGAPYAFLSRDGSKQPIGFEADIVRSIAEHLKREPFFVQNQWDGLIQGLKRKDYDLVINGLEVTESRRQQIYFTQPYYRTHAALTVRNKDSRIQKWYDVQGMRVGTLDGSLIAQFLKATPQKNIEPVLYDEEIHAYNDLALGRVDAVLLDYPIALYYAKQDPRLRTLTEEIYPIDYAIALRPEDHELQRQIEGAIEHLKKSGKLTEILVRWGLDFNSSLDKASDYQKFASQKQPQAWNQKLELYISLIPQLSRGALLTLGISIVAMALAILIGLLLVYFRVYGGHTSRAIAVAFIEFMRGTPLLIQLYLIFYGLPHIGIQLEPFWAAVIGLGLNYGACEAENYRSGLGAIPQAQSDAAKVLGLSRFQTLKYVLFPQAFRIALPPMTNDFIALLKDSSLVSVITMIELTTIYGQLASTYFDYLGIGLLVAAIYLIIGLPFVQLARHLERRLRPDFTR